MASFLSVIAAPMAQRFIEKGLFGRPYVRLGRLFIGIGAWLYQEGGALGYGLREQPGLLGKLLLQSRHPFGISPEEAVESLESLREVVASHLAQVEGQEKTFFHLYAARELRAQGIEIVAWPPGKEPKLETVRKDLNKKASLEMASDVMFVSFNMGGALGYYFPNSLREYWAHSYRALPESEWQKWRAQGIVSSERQESRPLEEAIRELAAAAVVWAAEEAPGLLDAQEIRVLNGLAASTGGPSS